VSEAGLGGGHPAPPGRRPLSVKALTISSECHNLMIESTHADRLLAAHDGCRSAAYLVVLRA
jgi:hypothetical protein